MVFLTGDPGAGKSATARVLRDVFQTRTVSVGDELRRESEKVARSLATEPFGPDEVVRRLVESLLVAPFPPRVVIDGYPRRPHQVKEMTTLILRAFGHHGRLFPVRVVWHSLSAERVLERYRAARYEFSTASGKFGPMGDTCPAGGIYAHPPEEPYLRKRRAQEPELQATLEELRRLTRNEDGRLDGPLFSLIEREA